MMKKILIVEDQILIADTIKRYLRGIAFEVVGIAISYQEAVQLFHDTAPDIALIDIYLNGKENGIDFAHFLSTQSNPIPFIFLTAQLDSEHVGKAKQTRPAGYLGKPIQQSSLLTTIEIALHNHEQTLKEQAFVHISDNGNMQKILVDQIESLKADHVYVDIILTNGRNLISRTPLREMLAQLPPNQFLQTHRSYAVNIRHLKNWDSQGIYYPKYSVPISRSYKKNVQQKLAALVVQNK
ncbi:MAG: response regulator [Spirosomataceae bacterium]